VRARWESLHAALVCSVTTLPARNQFQDLRRSNPSLVRFEDAASLLAHLTNRDGDLDEKDRIYGALVRTVQGRGPRSRLAYALLWGGLWPGLDRVYRRRLRYFANEPEELCQELSLAFTRLVETRNLQRVRRIAGTLVRSTDREVMDKRRRLLDELARRADDHDVTVSAVAGAATAADRDAGLLAVSLVDELAKLRARFLPVVGTDAELVLAVVVLEMDQREAAARLDLTYEVARKRLQRALGRLRTHLQATGDPSGMPESPVRTVNSSRPKKDQENES
jgi:DNA-directed RNA polymerase specialized sigma24 family protein